MKKSAVKFVGHNAVLFINPNAGSKHYNRLIEKLKKRAPDVEVILCHSSDELDAAFEKYLPVKKYFIVAGGDGTVHQAVKNLLDHPKKILAVYPNGSGNGFARELGFNQKIKKLLRGIKQNKTHKVDVLDLNGHSCVNVAGFGIDGAVSHAFAGSKRRGLFTYGWLTVKTLVRFKPFDATLAIEGTLISGKYMMISVANTRQFGNNAIISPRAKYNDGKLNITVVKPFPIWKFPSLVMQLFRGTLKNDDHVHFYTSAQPVKITASAAKQHIDGEAIELGIEVLISVKKKALTVLKV